MRFFQAFFAKVHSKLVKKFATERWLLKEREGIENML